VKLEAGWWCDKRGAQVTLHLQSAKSPVDYKLFEKHYDTGFQRLLAPRKCKFLQLLSTSSNSWPKASVTLSVARIAAAWFAPSCNSVQCDCNRFILSVIQSIVYTEHNIYRWVYFMFTYSVHVWKFLPYAVINYWQYEGWSKSFQTGAAICTAVELALSSGRW